MSQKTWQRLTLILTVAFGSISAALVIIGVVRLLPRALTQPADVLPAEHTLFFVENTNVETLNALRAWLPLPQPPANASGATLALMRLGDERTWVMLRSDPTRDPPFTVTAQNPAAAALVAYGDNRLGSSVPFITLHGDRDPGTWAWWNAALLNESTLLPSPLVDDLRAGSIVRRDGHVTITILPVRASTSSREAMPTLPGGSIAIGLQEPLRVLAMLERTLPGSVTIPVEGLLRDRLRGIWGDTVSLSGDLAPLLAHPAVFALDRTASGTAMLLRGTGDDDLAERLNDLFGRARAGGTPAIIDRRMIEGFTIDEVREGDGTSDEQVFEQGGWTVRIRQQGGGRTVCAADRYDAYVLSNHREACLQALRRDAANTPPQPGITPIAAGFINRPILQELRTLDLPGIMGILLRELPDGGATWSVQRKGDIFQIDIQ